MATLIKTIINFCPISKARKCTLRMFQPIWNQNFSPPANHVGRHFFTLQTCWSHMFVLGPRLVREIKHKDFIDVVPIISSQNLLWIMGSNIYGEGRTQIPQFTCYNRSPSTRSKIGRVYTDIKIANNADINHIVVFFTDLYNAISIDRLPSKTKIRKNSWYFKNSFWYKPEFPSTTKNSTFY